MPIRRRDRTTEDPEDPEDVDADVGRGGGGPVGDGQIGGGRDGLDGGGHGVGELEDVVAVTTAVASLEASLNSQPTAQGTGRVGVDR